MFSLPLFATIPHTEIPLHVATQPVPQEDQPWWDERHADKVEEAARGGIDVVFIGDSITQGWEDVGRIAWDRVFAPLRAANFGFSGDRTEHVLWRLDNGELRGPSPKAYVLLIGTNNVGHGVSSPAQTADGVRAIVARLRSAHPRARILLLGILPRGPIPEDPMRMAAVQATRQFKDLAVAKAVRFLDVGEHFLDAEGNLDVGLMPDYLHLSAEGYELLAREVVPELRKLLAV